MEGSTSKQEVTSSISTTHNEKDSFDGEKLTPKARFFTFEGLTPVSTVDDSREDRPDDAGREVSPLPRLSEHPEDRVQPVLSTPDGADEPPKRRCWSLTLEDAPFDEDPILTSHDVPQSCPNAVMAVKATPVKRMAPVDESPSSSDRVETPSDVSETSIGEKALPNSADASPILDEPAEALPTPDDPTEVLPSSKDGAPASTKTMPSSLLDDDAEEEDDDGIVVKDYEAIIMAPTDELEDRKMIESTILMEAEAADGCDVDICTHLVNSSNDICQSFSKLVSI